MRRPLLVTGSRHWIDREPVERALRWAWERQFRVLVHGGQAGLDSWADTIGRTLGFEVLPVEAKWHRFGDKAGPIRNAAMFHQHEPELVLAFPLQGSKGTWSAVTIGREAGVKVHVWPNSEPWTQALTP